MRPELSFKDAGGDGAPQRQHDGWVANVVETVLGLPICAWLARRCGFKHPGHDRTTQLDHALCRVCEDPETHRHCLASPGAGQHGHIHDLTM